MSRQATDSNNAFYERLTPDNAALLLIDHQVGLIPSVHSIDAVLLKNNIIGLAKLTKTLNLPVILTASGLDSPRGPLMTEITDIFPEHGVINRTIVNAMADPNFVAAVEKTNRKKLIMAALTTDVCLTFPAIAAVGAGYDVYAVIDASGTSNKQVEDVSVARMTQAGVIPTNWSAVLMEIVGEMSEAGQAVVKGVSDELAVLSKG
jgi:nicotinamidase-related amidase